MDEKSKRTQTKRAHTAGIVQAQKAESAVAIKKTVHQACRRKRGQPTKFNAALWESILEAVATYQDLIEICGQPNMPAVSTVYRWMRENPALKDDMRGAWELFSMLGRSYNQNVLRGGRLSTGDFRRDEALATDNRWFMGKVNRRDFGDKQQIDVVTTQVFLMPPDVIDGETF